MMLHKELTALVASLNGDTDFFEGWRAVGRHVAPNIFIICLDPILHTAIDPFNKHSFNQKKSFITDENCWRFSIYFPINLKGKSKYSMH